MLKFNLKVLLVEAEMTQQKFADSIGVSRQSVNEWVKNGRMPFHRMGDLISLVELANANCGRYHNDLEKLYLCKDVFY